MVFLKGRDFEERARDGLLEIRDPFLGPQRRIMIIVYWGLYWGTLS